MNLLVLILLPILPPLPVWPDLPPEPVRAPSRPHWRRIHPWEKREDWR